MKLIEQILWGYFWWLLLVLLGFTLYSCENNSTGIVERSRPIPDLHVWEDRPIVK